MSKLLIAGLMLMAVAVVSEPTLVQATGSFRTKPVAQKVAIRQPGSFVRPGLEEISASFESILADRVKETLSRAEQEMLMVEPQMKQTSGANAIEVKQLADQMVEASAKARQNLVDGNTLVALDFANQASSLVDQIKRSFERR